MDSWPVAVLLAAREDVVRQALRDMLRRSGIREMEHRSSCEEILEILGKGAKK